MGGRKDKEKEILEIFQVVKKAADGAAALSCGAEEGRCLDALKQLKAFPVTLQLLASTQVGRQLRPLTKHPRERIRVFTSELIGIWKKSFTKETEGNKKNGNGGVKASKSVKTEHTKKIQAAQAPVSAKVVKSPTSESVVVKKISTVESVEVEMSDQNTNWKTFLKSETYMAVKSDMKVEDVLVEQVKLEQTAKVAKFSPAKKLDEPVDPPKLGSLVKCHDDLRDKVRENLFDALSKVAREVNDEMKEAVEKADPVPVAVAVESAMFEKWSRTNGTHRAKYRSIMFNMNDSKNPDFRRRVLLGQITPDKIPTLSAEDMASDERKMTNEEIKRKALFECEREAAPKSTTDQFKCGKCGQRQTTYYQLQTRSADEPMTTFVTCVNCNNHWKFC